MKLENYIPYWLIIGRKNPWIVEADDPVFTKDMFCECSNVDELIQKFKRGYWCLGQAFYYKDLCFINQIDGGDEWLTIKGVISFESVSCRLIIDRDGEEEFKNLVERFFAASPKQLQRLEY